MPKYHFYVIFVKLKKANFWHCGFLPYEVSLAPFIDWGRAKLAGKNIFISCLMKKLQWWSFTKLYVWCNFCKLLLKYHPCSEFQKKYIFLINSICIQQLERRHEFCNCHFANCWFPCMKSICRIWQIFFALCEWTNSELIHFTITNLSFWLIRYSLNKVCCIITQGTVKINRLNLLASPTYLLNLKLLFNKMG